MIASPGFRWSRRCVATACLGMALLLVFSAVATAQTGDTKRPRPDVEERRREAARDSLRAEIARYAELIAELKSSVEDIESDEVAPDERVMQIEESAAAISEAIGAVAAQLAELEVEVDEGQISLSDGRGGRVTVEIPEDFGEQISKGISDITRVLLDEMPDTLRIGDIGDFETGVHFDRRGRSVAVAPVAPVAPLPLRKVIEGGVVKFKDDLEIGADEVILGDVVVIMGDAFIEGHVQGNVVSVLGDVTLAETAEVEGEVVTVLGRFDRTDGASIGSLTVVNPSDTYLPSALSSEAGDWIGFWGWQALFLLLLFLVLLMVALAPRERLDRVVATLSTRTAESFGVGLLMALVGHLVLLGLGVILVLTVIGIPVAILLLIVVALMDLLAVGVASLLVGRHLCSRGGFRCGVIWREVLLGMVVLHLPAFLASFLGAAGLPFFLVLLFSWLSRIVKFLAFCFGLGALVLGRFGNTTTAAPIPPSLDPVPETSGH